MDSYNVFSIRTKDYTTYPIHKEIPQIFDDKVIKLLDSRVSFELGGEKLSSVKHKLGEILSLLLSERRKPQGYIPPNNVEGYVFGEKLVLNLRDDIDKKLFWYGGIYRLMEDAIVYNYNLKFIPNDGRKYVDNNIDIELKIT